MATNNTSGTYDFNLEIGDVIQEATEMIGGEVTLGEEPRSARRSINLILNDWQNRGVCLWTTNTTIVSIAASTSQVSLKGEMPTVKAEPDKDVPMEPKTAKTAKHRLSVRSGRCISMPIRSEARDVGRSPLAIRSLRATCWMSGKPFGRVDLDGADYRI